MTEKDQSKSKSQKTVEKSDGASVDLSEGTSKPYLDEDGGYTEVNRAGPDEPRMDNVKAHGYAAEAAAKGDVQYLDRDQILNAESDEDAKKAKAKAEQLKKNELYLSAELEKQRVPRGPVNGSVECANCGARLIVEGDKTIHV